LFESSPSNFDFFDKGESEEIVETEAELLEKVQGIFKRENLTSRQYEDSLQDLEIGALAI